MSLYEYVVNSIVDEKDATSEYDDMMQATKDDELLSDSDKALIISIIASIKKDEQQHNTFLTVIKAILDDYKDAKKSVVEQRYVLVKLCDSEGIN